LSGIGESIEITIQFDPDSREIKLPEKFANSLIKNKAADIVFYNLPASRNSISPKKDTFIYIAGTLPSICLLPENEA
jgi:hypothetical protein